MESETLQMIWIIKFYIYIYIYIHTDKTGLEDLIEFQKAEFTITDGYYFNEGRNETINHVIEDLYSLRLKSKKR